MKKIITYFMTFCAVIALTACAPNISPNNYNYQNIGAASSVVPGTIVAARPVQVSNNTGTGTLAGGAAGAVAGSTIGGGWRANTLGAVGGAVIGGLLGNVAEKRLSNQTGIEYIVKTRSGKMMSVVQGPQPYLAVGQRVLVILGNPARIIVDNSYSR